MCDVLSMSSLEKPVLWGPSCELWEASEAAQHEPPKAKASAYSSKTGCPQVPVLFLQLMV